MIGFIYGICFTVFYGILSTIIIVIFWENVRCFCEQLGNNFRALFISSLILIIIVGIANGKITFNITCTEFIFATGFIIFLGLAITFLVTLLGELLKWLCEELGISLWVFFILSLMITLVVTIDICRM